MAFVQVKKCLTDPKQLAKLVVLVFCICLTIYQLSQCVSKITHPPVSTYYRFQLNETIKYPSLTICRRPMYKNNLFPKYGVPTSTSDLQANTAFESFYFQNSTIAEFLAETSYSMSETVALYGFNGQGNTKVSYKSIFVITKGQCHMLTPKENTDTFSISGGYFLYLSHNAQRRVKDLNGISTSGFEIFIHGDNEVISGVREESNSFMDTIYLEAGEEMHVTLSLQTFQQISSKNKPCVSDSDYSKSRCEEKCIHNQIAAKLGCTLPWLRDLEEDYPQCGDYASVKALANGLHNRNRTLFLQNCQHCGKSCNLAIYSSHVQSRKETDILQKPSVISIYFSSNLITTMQEVVGYDWNVFLSDVGASLGFLLGLSVIGAIAIMEDFVRTIWKRKNNDSNNSVSDNQAEQKESVLFNDQSKNETRV